MFKGRRPFRRTRILVFTAGLVLPAFSQTLIEPEKFPPAQKILDETAGPPLRCAVQSIPPTLDYRFRFSTGYRVTLPAAQVQGSEHALTLYVRVTPEGKQPVYLMHERTVPPAAENSPNDKAQVEMAGTFIIGEGKYEVKLVLLDAQHRSCRSTWQIDAERKSTERQMSSPIARGAVEDISRRRAPPAPTQAGGNRGITVLLHAGPLASCRRATRYWRAALYRSG